MATQAVSKPERATRFRILVADDERSIRELLAIVLRRDGYEVILAENGRTALNVLEQEPIDLLISDIKMPDMSGVEVLRAAKQVDQDILGIMITAFASTESAVEALRMGAYDYVSKPFDVDELKIIVRNALERRQLRQENLLLKRALQSSHQFSSIVGRSEAMLSVFKLIETVAPTNSTILVTGESGTGKELVARAIHFNSLRRDRPFVAVNCGALPEQLLESELFGHMRGSFTGASANKKGLVEVADRGTIFLDELGEMSPMMQVKLLRVLQERRFRRVGGTEEVEANIRVIAATNQDLAKMVADGRFREDLVLSRQCDSGSAAPPARSAGRHHTPGWALSREVSGPDGKERGEHFPGGDVVSRAVRLAREYSRARERHRAGRSPRVQCGNSDRQPAAPAARSADQERTHGDPAAGRRVRPRGSCRKHGARLHRAGIETGRWQAVQSRRTARHELPVVPLLREEVQPQVNLPVSGRAR